MIPVSTLGNARSNRTRRAESELCGRLDESARQRELNRIPLRPIAQSGRIRTGLHKSSELEMRRSQAKCFGERQEECYPQPKSPDFGSELWRGQRRVRQDLPRA